MSAAYQPAPVYHPFGLPLGTVRGFLSVLICSFFWIVLLLPESRAVRAPLPHFFLLTLVLLAFVSHPGREDDRSSRFLPWLMRFIFVGGSMAVGAYVYSLDPTRLNARLTPDPAENVLWPTLLATLLGGFFVGLAMRYVMGRSSHLYQTLRACTAIVAMLLLLAETVIQFVVIPNMAEKPAPESLKVWEGIVMAVTATYFGTRA